MPEPKEQSRRELAAQFFRLSRAFNAAEAPLLEANDIQMWDYVVLSALDRGVAPTQLELARMTGRDKTRIIGNLDSLEAAGLLGRRPDPMDRRAKIVEITSAGRDVVARCRAAIARMEDDALADIPDGDRRTFLNVLGRLTSDIAQRNVP
jgi:DNA-binding MarR family transcriptional regulator